MSEQEIWEQLKPQNIEYFDVEERVTQPRYSSVMWKLIERESNMFH
jgi:hypothetical protein